MPEKNKIGSTLYEAHWRLSFALNLRNLYFLQFHHLLIFMAWNWELQRFYLFLGLLNCFHWDILPWVFSIFTIWLCASSFLIKVSLNWENVWSTKLPYGLKFILLTFTTSWIPCSCSLFWYIGRKPDNLIKVTHGEHIFVEIKVYLALDNEGLTLLSEIAMFPLISLI